MQASRVMPSPSLLSTERHDAPLPRHAALAVGVAFAASLGVALLLAQWLALGTGFVALAAALAACGATLVLVLAARYSARRTFGAANTVTLARGAFAVVLLALLGVEPSVALGWLIVGLALGARALDGVDGKLARRRGEASAFGARFDMETDAFLILVLAALVWQHGKAGAWILLAGLLRYAFVAASYVLPWLAAELPPSRRRQTVCVLQIASLIGALAPFVTGSVASGLALAGLLVLVWSFGVDVGWLARHARV